MNERRGRCQRCPGEARLRRPRGQGPRRSAAWNRRRPAALHLAPSRNRPPEPTLARQASGRRPATPVPGLGTPLPRRGGRARPRQAPAPGARRPGQGDRGRGPDTHLLSDAHVVLAEQAADALREGVDSAAVAVLLGAASAPRRLRAGGQQPEQPEQQRQQQQEPSPGLGPSRGACSHPRAGGMQGSGRRVRALDAAAPAGTA